jgi:hypothetical protein
MRSYKAHLVRLIIVLNNLNLPARSALPGVDYSAGIYITPTSAPCIAPKPAMTSYPEKVQAITIAKVYLPLLFIFQGRVLNLFDA